jgi:hypothetical protein
MRIVSIRSLLAGAVLALALPLSAHEKHRHAPQQSQAPAAQTQAAPTREARAEWRVLLSHLEQPEYWHVLINPIPIFGSAFGALLLLVALWRRSADIRLIGLSVVLVTGVIVFPTVKVGQRAYDRIFETIPLEAQEWLDVHMERAEKFQYVFYLGAVLSLATLIAQRRRPELVDKLTKATLGATALSAALAGWIAHAGGQVRHEEFRMGPPSASSLQKAPPEPAPQREEHHQ